MPRGATLIELLLALAVLAVVLAIAAPGLRESRDRLLAREWAAALVAAHGRARHAALAEQRVMLLTISADSVLLRAVAAPGDTQERWRTAGPARDGVALSGGPRTIAFAPSGVAFGLANATYTLRRGAATKQVIVSRYGRVRVP
ncbi:MAG TPA: prepilin-type N-terminal cleavage/methylation domain-containing protein [Gemmatimonadales bacterium]|jgi:prepilin-type N-terminal cleavage/methylation domain-containing protein|nr:prepilin-type N-terminal cleavage/methylation domain-containing protein [Gemmatimonadales bacterium]